MDAGRAALPVASLAHMSSAPTVNSLGFSAVNTPPGFVGKSSQAFVVNTPGASVNTHGAFPANTPGIPVIKSTGASPANTQTVPSPVFPVARSTTAPVVKSPKKSPRSSAVKSAGDPARMSPRSSAVKSSGGPSLKLPGPAAAESLVQGTPNSPTRAHPSRKHARGGDEQNQNNNQETKNSCKIHVTGFPPYSQPQDLTRAFAKFGNVKLDKLCNKFAYISFSNEEEAKAALQASRKVQIYGEYLTVNPYNAKLAVEVKQPQTPKRDFPMSKQKGVIVDPQAIDLSGDFHQQLDRVLCTVRLTQEEATAISSLYGDLEKVLQPQWPGCVAMPFGSITTGLGIKTSDADCYVHVPNQFQCPNANFVNKAKRILQSYPHVFAEILSIPRANTPIVKFFHIPTEINCDLSFKTPLGTQNSKLIAFLLHADPRLIPMAVIIKYWAKVHGLSGTGKLTNYALTMMIIFYLQQPPMSILPSVAWLQRDRAYDVIVDYWNTGFIPRLDLLPPTTNTSSIAELLGGFFEFYATFNFQEMVVCPYLGRAIKKEAFVDANQLPNEFERYRLNVLNRLVMPMRINTSICVQDPFEQSHNVASAITSRLASEIVAFIKFAANSYEKEKLNRCQNFLRTILLDKPKIIRIKTHPEFRVNLFPRIIASIIDPDWKSVVREVLFIIFEELLKLKLGKVEEKVNPDTRKEKEKYVGTITKAIWKRKQFSRVYSMMNLDFISRQKRITEEVITVDKHVFNMQFQLIVTYVDNPKSSVVTIKLTEGDAETFKEFGKFYISVMQNWVISLLKPYVKPSTTNTATKIAETIKIIDGSLDDDDLDSDDNEAGNESAAVIANRPQSDDDSVATVMISDNGSNSLVQDSH